MSKKEWEKGIEEKIDFIFTREKEREDEEERKRIRMAMNPGLAYEKGLGYQPKPIEGIQGSDQCEPPTGESGIAPATKKEEKVKLEKCPRCGAGPECITSRAGRYECCKCNCSWKTEEQARCDLVWKVWKWVEKCDSERAFIPEFPGERWSFSVPRQDFLKFLSSLQKGG